MDDVHTGPDATLPPSPETYLDHLHADLAAIAAVPASALGAAVAACPGWSVADAIAHLGQVLGTVTARLSATPGERPSAPGLADGDDPMEYFAANAAALVDALESTDPEELRPNWSDDPRAAFYWRRMTHETLIHRHDIESAVGEAAAIDPAMALDGLDELCRVVLPHSGRRLSLPAAGETVHFHATDPGVDDTLPPGEFMVTFGPDGVVTETAHGKGDMAFRGRAVDLLLFAWNRSTAGVDAFGDGDPLTWWADNVVI